MEKISIIEKQLPKNETAKPEVPKSRVTNNVDAKDNVNFTREICGFIPQSNNKYSEKQDHLVRAHFKSRLKN